MGSHALHTLRKRFHLSGDARTPDRAVTPPFPGSSPSATGWRNSCWVLTRGTARTQDPIMSEWSSLRPPSDAGSRVVDDPLFRFLVDLEIQKARRLRYCVSLVCLAVDVAPVEAPQPSLPSLVELVTRHTRGTDVVARWAPASLALLLVDAETTHLPSIVRRLMAHLETLAWSAGGACYPKTATRTDDMIRQAVDSMVMAKKGGGNRLYVAS